MKNYDLAIIGGGIMGLACAVEAAQQGKKVCIIEKNEIGKKTSFAAGGILATRDAKIFHSSFREFLVRSIHIYPEWLENISSIAGEEIAITKSGAYYFFDISQKNAHKRFTFVRNQMRRDGASAYTELQEIPALLQETMNQGEYKMFHFSNEGHVDNHKLLILLQKACTALHITFYEHCLIENIENQQTSVTVTLPDTIINATYLLITAGVWSSNVLAFLKLSAPFVPVKGQSVRLPNFIKNKELIIVNDELYMIERGDYLIVGATKEVNEWDNTINDFGQSYLKEYLGHYFRSFDFTVLEQWAGLRPRTKDRLPLMGWVDEAKRILICAGHYKNGIGMAPLAARTMSALLEDKEPPIKIDSFNPLRSKGLQRLTA